MDATLITAALVAGGAWRLWRRHRRPAIPYHHNLDTTLLRIGRRDRLTIREACEGIAIFGGTGSGKTSGSGRALASAFLRAGMGGIVCCAKPGEAELWEDLARRHRRRHDIVRFDHTGAHRFNFLDYAAATIAGDGFETNLVHLLARVGEAARGQTRQAGDGGDNAFFREAAVQMLANALPLLRAAHGTLRVRDLYQFITSAPTSMAEAVDPAWQLRSFCAHTLVRCAHLADNGDRRAERVFDEHADYWLVEFASLGDRTRSSIVTTLTSTLYPFLSGKLHELFCTDTTLAPAEMTREGIVLVLDLPTRAFGPAGAVAQQIIKLLWQQVLEHQMIGKRTRPVFCWADEAQFFMNSYDTEHLSVCRQARVCNVFITQDLPTYDAQLASREAARALVAKFQTRIFHANTDQVTNNYAADIVGKVTKYHHSDSTTESRNSGGGGSTGEHESSYTAGHGLTRGQTRGKSSYQDYALPPEYFGQNLRTGGPKNRRRVDAVMLRAGGTYRPTRSNWIKAEFSQS